MSDPFTAPLLQLRHEIGTHLRRDFEMHKNATKIHQGSIYHPDNRLYGVLVFASSRLSNVRRISFPSLWEGIEGRGPNLQLWHRVGGSWVPAPNPCTFHYETEQCR